MSDKKLRRKLANYLKLHRRTTKWKFMWWSFVRVVLHVKVTRDVTLCSVIKYKYLFVFLFCFVFKECFQKCTKFSKFVFDDSWVVFDEWWFTLQVCCVCLHNFYYVYFFYLAGNIIWTVSRDGIGNERLITYLGMTQRKYVKPV